MTLYIYTTRLFFSNIYIDNYISIDAVYLYIYKSVNLKFSILIFSLSDFVPKIVV